ncbi:helix-turn-helix domain-containing protein [Blastopirellula retiformator]|uniref:Anaerobic benzoate catabolism transcriptional regulator n=1 Tax=Blastopirellula retiformator TaxID=2527970 RepID=A0A5C5V468_9BACT|nr:helix-turn-helix domain-containing protein [Blastopirellula retiformator]TWT32860.1 anaerobic benzoate catabolism transcriptional regulator [Blastopirellula retiformator]
MTSTTKSDDEILRELGDRLRRERLNRNLTQAHLAAEAGIARRTLQKAEEGEVTTLATMVAILRGLGLLSQLENLLPEQTLSPVQLARMQGRERRRASQSKKKGQDFGSWTWGE